MGARSMEASSNFDLPNPEALVIPPDNRVLFFERDKATFGFLSHMWPSPILLDGERWRTVEHYYQSRKSENPEYRAAVRDAATPGRAKRLAVPPHVTGWRSRQSWFRRNGGEPRADWDAVKLDVMRRTDLAKYAQNPELAALLLATGGAEIVEDSPGDRFWGIGRDGAGLNWAGRILMEVREKLRAESGAEAS